MCEKVKERTTGDGSFKREERKSRESSREKEKKGQGKEEERTEG